MEKYQYIRASQLNAEIEYNERLVDELTSWLASERFKGVTMCFVNEEGEQRTERIFLEGDKGRDIAEHARRRVEQILRKQIQEFKKL